MPLSEYQQAMPGIERLGQVGYQIANGLARQRALQEYQRQQLMLRLMELAQQAQQDRVRASLYGAQTKESEAQAAYHAARTKAIADEQAIADSLGLAIRGYQQYQVPPSGREEGPFEQTARLANAQQQFLNLVQQAGALGGRGNQYAMPTAAQGLQINEPRFQQFLGLDQRPMVSVGPESTALNALTGEPIYRSPIELGRGANLVSPEAPHQTLAQGQPPATANELNLSRLLASNQALLNTLMPLGVPPTPGSSKFPIFQTTTNQLAQLQALIGAELQARQGTNLSPVQRSEELQSGVGFQSLEEAKRAGKVSGDVIQLWDPNRNRFRPFQID
jgi:hypothetical protein